MIREFGGEPVVCSGDPICDSCDLDKDGVLANCEIYACMIHN